MFVEILLLILIGLIIFGSYMIIMRLNSYDKRIKDLYQIFDEIQHSTRRVQDLLMDMRERNHEIRHLLMELNERNREIYEMTNGRLQQIEDFLHLIDFRSIDNLRERFIRLEETVVERVAHMDKLFENINLRFEYFSNRLQLINTKVDYLLPNKKIRTNKKINLINKFRAHRTFD
jgi:hypothetical protein